MVRRGEVAMADDTRIKVHVESGGWIGAVWFWGWLYTLGYLHLVCVQTVLPNYMGGSWYFDWWMHYDVTSVLLRAPGHPLTTHWSTDEYTLAFQFKPAKG